MTVLNSLEWKEAYIRFSAFMKTHSANGGQASRGMIMLGLKRWVKRNDISMGRNFQLIALVGVQVKPQQPSTFK